MKIKVNELRIGNYIHMYGEDYSKVTGISIGVDDEESVSVVYPDGEHICDEDLDSYQSIPLTEEWLLKFGFEKNNLGGWQTFSKENIHIIVNGREFMLRKYDSSRELHICLNIVETVHQLQNVFFSLEEKELTVDALK